jgi:hypothetical protein
MAKSRKSPGSILRFGPLALAFVLCAFFAASAIGYVWHRNRNEQLLRDNAQRVRILDSLRKQNQQLEFVFLGATRPEALFEQAKRLGLVRPEPAQILRVEETPVGTPTLPPTLPVHLAARAAPR